MRLSTVFSARGLVALALVCAAAAPLSAQTPDTTQAKQHVVKKGDTLWDLAQFYCNNPFTWPTIYNANKGVVENPHWIYPSEKLMIPCQLPDSTPAAQVVMRGPVPTRTRFYIPERTDTGTTIISSELAQIPLVQSGEWLAAPYLADTAQLGIKARVFKPYDPRDQHDKLTQNFHPRDRLFLALTGPAAANDRLLAIRLGKDITGFGWVIQPLGILRVDSVGDGNAVAMITSQFGDLKVGDVAIPLPAVPALPVGTTIEVTGGPNGQILDFMVQHPLYGNTDYAFINLGTTQGLSIGDELVAYLPERQPSQKDPASLPEQAVARLRVVRVNTGNATARVIGLKNTGLKSGLLLRVARKAPAGAATGTSSVPTGPAVNLKFGWPAGVEALVEVKKVRVRGVAQKDSAVSALSYRMRSSASGDGLLISYDKFSIPTAIGKEAGADVQALLGALLPNYEVSKEGDFVRVIGLDALRAKVEEIMGPALPALKRNPEAEQIFRNLLTDEALTNAAAQDWNAMVGLWLDAEMRKGEVLTNKGDEPNPLMPDMSWPMRYEFRLNDWVPCEEHLQTRDCVELEMRSYPEQAAVKAFMEKLLAAGGDADKDSQLESVQIQNRIVVVTNPQRLIPYRLSIAKDVSGAGKDKGKTVPFASHEVKTYLFHYTHI